MEHSCSVALLVAFIYLSLSLADILWLVWDIVVKAMDLGVSQTPYQGAILSWIALNKANLSKYWL